MNEDDPLKRDFRAALERLASEDGPGAPGVLNHLTHPTDRELRHFAAQWPTIDPDRRRRIARQLHDAAEADVHMDFRRLFEHMLDDPEPQVRAVAIDGLWESQDVRLLDRFTAILREDEVATVRESAAGAIGRFVRLEELGEIRSGRSREALRLLISHAENPQEDVGVRRRAVASAGYADREEVGAVIARLIAERELVLKAGAIRAMGHSLDERWEDEVISWLDADEAELRFEAAHAAGELWTEAAVPRLAELALGDEPPVRREAIWALGEIGGERAIRLLDALLERETEDEMLRTIEDARSSAALSEGELRMPGLGLGPLGGASDLGLEEDGARDPLDDDDEWIAMQEPLPEDLGGPNGTAGQGDGNGFSDDPVVEDDG